MPRVAVIGGGLTALSCALHLAEHGIETELFEAAPQLGGRTRSFYERAVDEWVDNGPHLLIGAYRHARAFFAHHGVTDLAWQPHLELPLWDAARGPFDLSPGRWLPLPLSLAWACSRLPGHGAATLLAMKRLGAAIKRPVPDDTPTAAWMRQLGIPTPLKRDLLEPLCLAAMNEPSHTAPASSFARVLKEAFADHDAARLGWFTRPLAQGLIAPLEHALERHGARIHRSSRITAIEPHPEQPGLRLRSGNRKRFDRIVLTLPAHARDRLLGLSSSIATRPISNVHLWFDEDVRLAHPFVGGIGTLGHWFFDISRQMPGTQTRYRHVCAVISAASPTASQHWSEQLCGELARMLGRPGLRARHTRIVHEQRATMLVRPAGAPPQLPGSILDAGEHPRPGDLPATIETAVARGQQAAREILSTAR